MPQGRRRHEKGESLRQTSLMTFVSKSNLTENHKFSKPNSPTFTEGNSSIIFGTPDVGVSTSRVTRSPKALPQAPPFTSSTGDVVQPPHKHPQNVQPRRHQKPRRSAFVTQRHALVMAAKVEADGNCGLPRRQGDYDSLNYAPMHQNPLPSTSPITFASERAKKMAQLATAAALENVKVEGIARPAKRLLAESSLERSFIFEEEISAPASKALRTSLQTPRLDSQEADALKEVLKEIVNNEVPEVKVSDVTSKVKKKSKVCRPAHGSSLNYQSKVTLTNTDNQQNNNLEDESPGVIINGHCDLEDSFTNFIANGCLGEWDGPKIMQDPMGGAGKRQLRWLRCRVMNLTSDRHSLVISANRVNEGKTFTVRLAGTWANTPVRVGDIFNLVPSQEDVVTALEDHEDWEMSDSSSTSVVNTFPSLFVLHPDVLISGTTVAGSSTCMRRCVIQNFWSENEPISVPSSSSSSSSSSSDSSHAKAPGSRQLMLVGSIIHEVFQKVVEDHCCGRRTSPKEALFQSIYTCSTILQMYALGIRVKEFSDDLQAILPTIDRWIADNCHYGTSTSPKPTLEKITAIEENIWCTKIGVKGKIDMTITCRVSSDEKHCLVPLELKTGKPSYSFEHIGQVLLYILMLADRHADRLADLNDVSKFGLLVYLRESDKSGRGLIKPHATSFRGLIQTRNQLAASLKALLASENLTGNLEMWNPRLPAPIDRDRICSRCPHLLTCGLFRDDSVRTLLEGCLGHVASRHRDFLRYWTRLQLLEYASGNLVEKVISDIMSESLTNCVPARSNAIRNLVLRDCSKSNDQRSFLSTLKRSDCEFLPLSNNRTPLPGDFLIVSSDDGRHVGVCLASLVDVNLIEDGATQDAFIIKTDRPLPTWIDCFRLDRYVSDKGAQINLANLIGLMMDSPLCSRLRKLIIDQECPRFTYSITKPMLLQIRKYLKPLNVHQRKAILSVLMSKDYTLIEGFPGSGKTETLATLLRCLAVLGRRSLLIAHTHSAVDNVLLRLLGHSEVSFVRLGAPEKINSALLTHNLEDRLSRRLSMRSSDGAVGGTIATQCSQIVDTVDEIMTQANVVGCTALGAGGGANQQHAALARLQFDVVIVDEATQLLLPTVLGGLLHLEAMSGQFVLVGDANQLPPLVKSKAARIEGFSTSLFSLLMPIVERHEKSQATESIDSQGSCRVQLKFQYRMNSHILHLANTLFYSGQMECASGEVQNATLRVAMPSGYQPQEWLIRVLSPSLLDAVVLLDTHSVCTRHKEPSSSLGNANAREVDLVFMVVTALLRVGVAPEEVGVIAPYRIQVAALKRRLRGEGTFEVNTADQYQGRDKSIIIVSFVDCLQSDLRPEEEETDSTTDKPSAACSLLNELPRLNVALTRAKHKLILIGCGGRPLSTNSPPSGLKQMLSVLCDMSAVVQMPVET